MGRPRRPHAHLPSPSQVPLSLVPSQTTNRHSPNHLRSNAAQSAQVGRYRRQPMARPRTRPGSLERDHRRRGMLLSSGLSSSYGPRHQKLHEPAASTDSRRCSAPSGVGPSSPTGCRPNTTASGSHREAASSGSSAPRAPFSPSFYCPTFECDSRTRTVTVWSPQT